MKRAAKQELPKTPIIRCAIYTRKSTEEGLNQEFNSLDAQRESAEAYIASQQHEGWLCLPNRYDDGGYTGGNTDRPGLRQLLADIDGDQVDAVVVYKVDRLSRSLSDFSRLMEDFEKRRVSFVSVTQQFNTSTSMGRLMLNVLLSFAQFEREMIAERTRDKMSAARRRGQWLGGMPVLGYDVAETKLVVNDLEAAQIRQIFSLYVQLQGLIPVVQELERLNWRNKEWTTKDGRKRGGRAITKTSLYRLLTNVTYLGQVAHKGAIYEGKHAAIVDVALWQQAQSILASNGQTGGAQVRNRFGALLKGILRCTPCGCAMTPTHSTKNKNHRYRYYVCSNAQKRGRQCCPSRSIPANEIEQLVLGHIRRIGRDPVLVTETLAAARNQTESQVSQLQGELRLLEHDLASWDADVRKMLTQMGDARVDSAAVARLADLQERIGGAECRAAETQQQIASLRQQDIDPEQAVRALASFDPVWEALTPREQAQLIQLLVKRVDYDGRDGKVRITLHDSGVRALVERQAENAA